MSMEVLETWSFTEGQNSTQWTPVHVLQHRTKNETDVIVYRKLLPQTIFFSQNIHKYGKLVHMLLELVILGRVNMKAAPVSEDITFWRDTTWAEWRHVFFNDWALGRDVLPLGGILALPECVCGLENVTIDVVVISKWVKLQFWANSPFKLDSFMRSRSTVWT